MAPAPEMAGMRILASGKFGQAEAAFGEQLKVASKELQDSQEKAFLDAYPQVARQLTHHLSYEDLVKEGAGACPPRL